MHPPFSFRLAEKKTGRARSKRKTLSCPNPAWRQVRAKTGVLAGERRIFAGWSLRWARARVCGNRKWSARDETWKRIVGANRTGSASLFAAAPWVVNSSGLEDYRRSISGGEVQNRGPRPPGLVGQEGVWGNPIERVPPRSLLDRRSVKQTCL